MTKSDRQQAKMTMTSVKIMTIMTNL